MAPVQGANYCEDVDHFLVNLASPSSGYRTAPPQPVTEQHNAVLLTMPENVRMILAEHCYTVVPENFVLTVEHPRSERYNLYSWLYSA